jgi:drug/metabolite transporter (DMT)-like permease
MISHPHPDRSAYSARASLVLAALLWSSGSFFMRCFTVETGLGTDRPHLPAIQIAFWRGLFAGMTLLPLVRLTNVRIRPRMLAMMATFATMCGLYLTALGEGNAANAILLQNTSPVWVYVIGVLLLGHTADRGALPATLLAALGAGVIVFGNWPWNRSAVEQARDIPVLLMGVGSGLTYAGVVLFLGSLNKECPAWLMVLNLFGSAGFIGIYISATQDWQVPTIGQAAVLALFGAFQMAIPYWLFARGLKHVSPQEAGIITLLEPVLNPVWAYLLDPERDTPTFWTLLGGGILLAALTIKYLPRNR